MRNHFRIGSFRNGGSAETNADLLVMIAKLPTDAPVVVIVEDEPLVRDLACEMLAEHGVQVLQASNAAEALSLLDRRPDVRLVFSDINMPGQMDGLALAREVHRRWPQMLLMLTSGRGGLPKDAIPGEGEFVPKPYDFDELADKIQALLKSR